MFGWAGRIIEVDLTDKAVRVVPLAEDLVRTFLGGQGLAQKLISDRYDFTRLRDPFASENLVCVSAGALSGTLSPGSSRVSISVAVSPSLGGYLDANAGGGFAAMLKYAGYDAILVWGKAPHPVYLAIDDDRVELRDARPLAGRRIRETVEALRADMGGRRVSTLAIGPSGENRVHGAMVTCELHRAASGGSIGAVLGSKGLKAIVAHGSRGVPVADPAEVFAAFQAAFDRNRADPRFRRFGEQGTKWLVDLGGVLTCQYNVQARPFPYDKLAVREFLARYAVRSKACHACFQHCDHHWHIPEGRFAGEQSRGGEAGTIIPLGPGCGLADYGAILHLGALVDDLGLDSIATGSMVATAMQWWEEGLLTPADTDGFALPWGDAAVIEEAILQIAYRRRGLGELLAEGLFHAAEVLAERRGVPAERLTRLIRTNRKRRELGADYRPMKGLAFSKGLDVRECDVLNTDTLLAEGEVDLARLLRIGIPEPIARKWVDTYIANPFVFDDKSLAKYYYDAHTSVCNSLGICQRYTTWAQMPMGLEAMARCLTAVTGVNYTWEDLLRCGERIRQIERAIQLQSGFRKEHDFLPDHYYNDPVREGRFAGAVLDREEYTRELERLYELFGWDREGRPRKARLVDLGLGDVAERLAACGLLSPE